MPAPDETKFVDLGGSATVDLPDAGLSGYKWEVTSAPSVSVRRSTTPFDLSRGIGGVGTDVFEVTPARRGKTVVVFRLRRPWETRALRQRRVEVIAR